jgi:peptide/nickel transport system substrate-binding protein
MKKVVVSLTQCLLLLFSVLPLASTAPPIIKNPDKLVIAVNHWYQPATIDPAWAYGVSENYILNIYEPLIFYDGERNYRFIPMLSTAVPDIWWVPNVLVQNITGAGSGLVTSTGYQQKWYWRIYFPIRVGVPFHIPPYTLTPEDVEYSLERALVEWRRGGPAWMLYEMFFGIGHYSPFDLGNLSDDSDVVIIGRMIDLCISSNATHVWLNLGSGTPYGPYAPTLHVLARACASIISKQWVNDIVIGTHGRQEWSGYWGNYSYDFWLKYTLPQISPLDDPFPLECGTGPYKLTTWDKIQQYWQVDRFVNYWGGWPAKFPAPPYPSFDPYKKHLPPAGFIERVVVTWAFDDWPTRRVLFLAGDIDLCMVPPAARDELLGEPGIRCIYPLLDLGFGAMFFQFYIIWPPFYWIPPPEFHVYPQGEFHEDGIPRDFFSDVRVRKAFAYAFNYTLFIQSELLGEAIRPATALVPGLTLDSCPYKPLSQSYAYEYNYSKAVQEFQAVPGLWDTGFTIAIPYLDGSIHETAAYILKDNIERMNSKFHVICVPLNYYAYFNAMFYGELPIFFAVWHADYSDVHSVAYQLYHSTGLFPCIQNYINPMIDDLVEAGAVVTNIDMRETIYHQIELLALEDCPNVPLYQNVLRHYQRDWLNGWYYNPAYSLFSYGILHFYAYPLWKGYYTPHKYLDTPQQPWSSFQPFDIDYSGSVTMDDIGFACLAFGSNAVGMYGEPEKRWNFRADVDNNRQVDMTDIGWICYSFGK